jgi:uncharacterized protein YqgC (DUF456 family)
MEDNMETVGYVLVWVLVVACFLVGFVGLFISVLPETLAVLAGFVLYHFLIDPHVLGWSFWTGVILLTAFSMLIDYIAGGIAARKYGASKWATWAAIIGTIVFPILLGPLGLIGLIIGPFVAVVLVELLQRKPFGQAVRAGFGTWVGMISGIFFKGLIMVVMIVWFLILVL